MVVWFLGFLRGEFLLGVEPVRYGYWGGCGGLILKSVGGGNWWLVKKVGGG